MSKTKRTISNAKENFRFKRFAKKVFTGLMSMIIIVGVLPISANANASNEFVNAPPENVSSISSVFTTVGDTTVLTGKYDNVAMITYDVTNQTGALWAADKLDLSLPFSTEMMIHLGHSKGGSGKLADGMTFTMHNDNRGYSALGGRGEGLGAYQGRIVDGGDLKDGDRIRNSLAIEFDTHYNMYISNDGFFISDPEEANLSQENQRAHCAAMVPNKDILQAIDHKNVFFFDATQDWELFTVRWEPQLKSGKLGGKLIYTFRDSTERVFPIEDVIEIFGSAEVYWGFTGSTGSMTSYQAAAITKLPTQEMIVNKDVKNADGESVDGKKVSVGDVLTYSIDVIATKAVAGIGPIEVKDVLSSFTSYVGDDVRLKSSGNPTEHITPRFQGAEMIVDTGVVLRNVGESLNIEFEVEVLENSIGSVIKNRATAMAINLTEPQKSNITEVEVNKTSFKIVCSKSRSGARGNPVKPGDEVVFRIGYVNGGENVSDLTITDTLDAGLTYVSSSDNGVYDSGTRTVKWEISSINPGDYGNVTLTAKVNSYAEELIVNKANLNWKDGDDEEPEVEIPVKGSYKIVDKSSEAGVEGSPVTIGDKVTFKIGYLNPTGETANLEIKDTISDSMEYVAGSATGGGVYNATDKTIAWQIDSIPKDGSGNVTFEAEVINANNSIIKNTAEMLWKYGNETDEEEPYVEIPVGSYKIAVAAPFSGNEITSVIPGDEITYKICYLNTTGNSADLTVTDKLPIGVEYISHSGTLVNPYNDIDRELVWELKSVPENATGILYVTVKITEDAGNTVVNKATLAWGNGSEENPEVEVDVRSYKKIADGSIVGENGMAAVPGDIIEYRIGYVNNRDVDADLKVTDMLDKGLVFKESLPPPAAESVIEDGKLIWNFTGVPRESSGFITLKVQVNDTVGKEIYNAALLEWSDGQDENPNITTPVGSYKVVDSSSMSGKEGKAVKPGDEITFRIGYWNNSDKYRSLIIQDTLDMGVEYVSSHFEDMQSSGTYNRESRTVLWPIGLVAPNKSGYVFLKIRVTDKASAIIKNHADMKWENEVPEPGPEIEIPLVSYKIVSVDSGAGIGGAAVNIGDSVVCKIGFVNHTGAVAELEITDVLPPEVGYLSHKNGNVSLSQIVESSFSGGNRVYWKIKDIPVLGTGYVEVEFIVKENAGAIIKNIAQLNWSTQLEPENPELEIPVKSKKYVENGAGAGGTSVDVGEIIEYQINYINRTGSIADLTIEDTLPEGTKYVEHVAGGATNSNYDNAKRVVTWKFNDLPISANGKVSLTVKVEEAVSKTIVNIANMEWTYGNGKEIEKPSVEVPLGLFKIVYDPNEGLGGAIKENLAFGDKHQVYTQSQANVSREGYKLTGWKTEVAGGDTYAVGSEITVKGDLTLYAQWQKEEEIVTRNRFKVIYNANGGEGGFEENDIQEGSGYTVLGLKETKITRGGFVFIEWNSKPDGTGESYEEKSKLEITQDIILYAQWKPATSLDTENHFAYIVGYPNGNVSPESNISRAEVATIFFRLLKIEDRKDMWSKQNSFQDVPSSTWYNNAVSTLTNGGILQGYSNDRFGPNRPITRAEFAVIAVRFADDNSSLGEGVQFKDIAGHWAEEDIKKAAALGYVSGYSDGRFGPQNFITRAEVATLVNNVLNRHVESQVDMRSDMVTWPDNLPSKWYYYALQEATNSHYYDRKEDQKNEVWNEIRPVPNWMLLEKPSSEADDVKY